MERLRHTCSWVLVLFFFNEYKKKGILMYNAKPVDYGFIQKLLTFF